MLGIGLAITNTFTGAFVADASISALNPLRWWKPDISQVAKSSDRLSQVNDLSGNGAHLLQTTETEKALWVDNVINGKPVMRFDDTDINFDFTSVSPTDVTVYLVLKPDAEITSATGFQSLLSRASAVQPRGLISFGSTTGNIANETLSFVAVDGVQVFGVAMTSNISSAFHILMFKLDGTTETIRIDKADESLNVSSVGGLDASNDRRFINVDEIGRAVNSFDGDIAEVIIFDNAHSSGNITTVENYFNSEFGL